MQVVRLRTRDGIERVSVKDCITLQDLRNRVSQHIDRPCSQFVLSTDKSLLTSKDPDTFLDLSDDLATLQSLGFTNGQVVFCHYEGSREVDPGYKRSPFDSKPFGVHMDVGQLMAKQVRIERQESPHIAAVSFDRYAANAFQAYVQSALAFSIKRCGILYGRLDADNKVFVDAIYEPEQTGKAERLAFVQDDALGKAADVIAGHLGMQRVGLIFNQSAGEREYIMNDEEVWQACQMQAEAGDHCVTAVFSQIEEDGHKEIHLEAFQCSKQAVQLWRDGWFKAPAEHEVCGFSKLLNPHDATQKLPVMISGKDTDQVDNDFFLVPLPVQDHQGPLMTSFPIETRLTGQTVTDLSTHLRKHSDKEYSERLADFHLLLWLVSNSGLDLMTDMALLVEAVHKKLPVLEGYKMMIDTVAGL